jgi:hypothetical protein
VRRRRGYRHLPRGHRPGRQSRRRASRLRKTWRAAAILFGFLVAAGAFLGLLSLLGTVFGIDAAEAVVYWVLVGSVLATVGIVVLLEIDPVSSSKDVALEVAPSQVARGQWVGVTVSPRRVGAAVSDVEVGLLCIQFADAWFDQWGRWYRSIDDMPDSTGPRRDTVEEIAHEVWRDVALDDDVELLFKVPEWAPYSYEGECLSFAWRAAAKHRGEFAVAEAHVPVWVTP